MRSLSTAAANALAGRAVPLALLIQMDLSSTLRVCSAGVDIEYGGHTWLGAARVGNVEAIEDTAGERRGLRFTLSAVPADQLAVALSEATRGKRCRVYEAIYDPATYAVLAAPLVWSGTLDPMVITEPADPSGGCVIQVTAEHRGTTFARPKPLRYTDSDQRRLHPGDRSMEFMVSQANHQDVWPAAAYFKQ